jgi:hypothetical protein
MEMSERKAATKAAFAFHTINSTDLITATSAFGTKRTSKRRPAMSAFGGKADVVISGRHVCF